MIDLYRKYKINNFVAAFITFLANVKLNHKNLIPWSLFFWNYFEKVAHKLVSKRLYLCGFVCLDVCCRGQLG